jgi:hypothetical protein
VVREMGYGHEELNNQGEVRLALFMTPCPNLSRGSVWVGKPALPAPIVPHATSLGKKSVRKAAVVSSRSIFGISPWGLRAVRASSVRSAPVGITYIEFGPILRFFPPIPPRPYAVASPSLPRHDLRSNRTILSVTYRMHAHPGGIECPKSFNAAVGSAPAVRPAPASG